MKRKLKITVEGNTYEVEVEEIVETIAASKSIIQESVKEAPKAVPKVTLEKGEAVLAPIPGEVISVRVKQGDIVEVGQVMLILDAMKIENEITAPIDGRIKDVLVQEGQTVNARGVMLVIE